MGSLPILSVLSSGPRFQRTSVEHIPLRSLPRSPHPIGPSPNDSIKQSDSERQVAPEFARLVRCSSVSTAPHGFRGAARRTRRVSCVVRTPAEAHGSPSLAMGYVMETQLDTLDSRIGRTGVGQGLPRGTLIFSALNLEMLTPKLPVLFAFAGEALGLPGA